MRSTRCVKPRWIAAKHRHLGDNMKGRLVIRWRCDAEKTPAKTVNMGRKLPEILDIHTPFDTRDDRVAMCREPVEMVNWYSIFDN